MDFCFELVGEYLAKNVTKIALNPKDLAVIPVDILKAWALSGAGVPASVVDLTNPEHVARVKAEIQKFKPSRKCKRLEAINFLLQGLDLLINKGIA